MLKFEEENVRLSEEIQALHKWVLHSDTNSQLNLPICKCLTKSLQFPKTLSEADARQTEAVKECQTGLNTWNELLRQLQKQP